MNLQYFAADGGNGDGGQQATPPEAGADATKTEPSKSFSRDDVAKMMAAERAKIVKEFEEKQEEAKKLAKMNAEEKLQHLLEQKESELEQLKRKQSLSEMTKEASKMLSEAELPHDEELLELITNEDAEATKKAVNIITSYVAKIKKESARQTTPADGGKFEADKNVQLDLSSMAQKNRIIKN